MVDRPEVLQEPVNTSPIGGVAPVIMLPTPNTAISAKRNLALLQPPLQTQIPAMTQTVLAVPAGVTGQPANLLPVVPYRTLSGGETGSRGWAIPLNLVGKTAYTLRVSYRDLHITPGIRGIVFNWASTGGDVTITCNQTGAAWFISRGKAIGSLPLVMADNLIDLTISTSTGTFPAGTTILLTSDVQQPFVSATPFQAAASVAINQISVGTTATLISAARTSRISLIATNLGTTDVFVGDATVTILNGTLLLGVKGTAITVPFRGAFYGIVAAGTQTVSIMEMYG